MLSGVRSMVLPRRAMAMVMAVALLWWGLGVALAAEKQLVLGAGPSMEVSRWFFQNFGKLPVAQGYAFEVEERSIKHAGGMEASGKFLFGRTGRPLNAEEKALNKQEIFLALVPIGFVVGEKAGVHSMTLKQLLDIFAQRITNWKELGGADQKIVIAGREPTEAAWTILKEAYPEIAQVNFHQVLQRDHQVVNFMDSPAGAYAIAFGFRGNFADSKLLDVKGLQAGSNCGLVYDTRNADHPVVKAAVDYARSNDWRKLAQQKGFLPPSRQR